MSTRAQLIYGGWVAKWRSDPFKWPVSHRTRLTVAFIGKAKTHLRCQVGNPADHLHLAFLRLARSLSPAFTPELRPRPVRHQVCKALRAAVEPCYRLLTALSIVLEYPHRNGQNGANHLDFPVVAQGSLL